MQKAIHDKYKYKNGKLFYKNPSKFHSRIRKDKEAGGVNSIGYWIVRFNGLAELRSRIIFFMFNGFYPEVVLHKNGNKLDDRIKNLKGGTLVDAQKNKKTYSNSGHRFIYTQKKPDCEQGFFYTFYITEKGKTKRIKSSVDLKKLIGFRDKYLKKYDKQRYKMCKNEKL